MKSAIYRVPGSSGIARGFAYVNRRKPIVIAFHGVTSEPPGHLCNYQGKHLHLPIFTRAMEHLRTVYQPIPLSRVVEWLEGRADVPKRAVVVTFDDGYRNVFTNAVPVLSRLEIPATVYVVTDFVRDGKMVWTDRIVSALAVTKKTHFTARSNGGSVELPIRNDQEKAVADEKIRSLCKSLPDREREALIGRVIVNLGVAESEIASAWSDQEPLRPEELKSLSDQGIEVGSHTKSHKILTRCTPDEVRRELEESRRFIEDVTGKPCSEFSYPNGRPGDFDERTGNGAREAGYRCAATCIPERVSRGHGPFEIPRYTLGHNEMALAEFAADVSGYTDFLRGIRRIVLPGATGCDAG